VDGRFSLGFFFFLKGIFGLDIRGNEPAREDPARFPSPFPSHFPGQFSEGRSDVKVATSRRPVLFFFPLPPPHRPRTKLMRVNQLPRGDSFFFPPLGRQPGLVRYQEARAWRMPKPPPFFFFLFFPFGLRRNHTRWGRARQMGRPPCFSLPGQGLFLFPLFSCGRNGTRNLTTCALMGLLFLAEPFPPPFFPPLPPDPTRRERGIRRRIGTAHVDPFLSIAPFFPPFSSPFIPALGRRRARRVSNG